MTNLVQEEETKLYEKIIFFSPWHKKCKLIQRLKIMGAMCNNSFPKGSATAKSIRTIGKSIIILLRHHELELKLRSFLNYNYFINFIFLAYSKITLH